MTETKIIDTNRSDFHPNQRMDVRIYEIPRKRKDFSVLKVSTTRRVPKYFGCPY